MKTVFLFATSSTSFLRGKTWTFYTEKRTHLTKGKFKMIVYFMVYRLLFRVLYIIRVRRIIEIRKNNKSSKIYKGKKIACRWEQNLPLHKEVQKISQVIHASKRNEFIDAMKVHLTSYRGIRFGLNISFFNTTCFVLFSIH